MRLKHFLIFFLTAATQVSGQSSTLRIKVAGPFENHLSGASVYLKGPLYSNAVTDSTGSVSFTDLPEGNYRLTIDHLAYATDSSTLVSFQKGKQHVVDVSLKGRHIQLKEVDVFEASDFDIFSADEVKRYPAAFADPGRLAMFSASSYAIDDQANHISVRGAHPYQNKWFLEGVEVLNPNHLENAGTFPDRPGASGGGVNIFSTLVTDRSRFMKGVLPVQYNNITGGAFDIDLRKGNDELFEHTFQASLLGTEVSSEGPLTRNRSSYLVNVRYSTVGLLSLGGVNFGGEKINYYDATTVFNVSAGKVKLKAFVVAGKSSNIHEAVTDTSDVEAYKDFQHIRYYSNTVIAGASASRNVSSSTSVHATLAGSDKMNYRSENGPFSESSETEQNESMLSYRIEGKTFGKQSVLRYGVSGNFTDSRNTYNYLCSPFITHEKGFEYITIETGVSVFKVKERTLLDPRLGVVYRINRTNSLAFRAGSRSQVIRENVFVTFNGLLHSNDAEISHQFNDKGAGIKMSVFYQKTVNIARISDDPSFYYISKGVELTAEKKSELVSLLISASVFDVNDEGSNIENSYFDFGYGFNIYAGKELRLENSRKLTIDLRFHYHQGGFQNQIDIPASYFSSETIFSDQLIRLPSYFRTDLRISLIQSRKRSTMLFLDIQNLLNTKNTSGYYYDPFLGSTLKKEQLGIIPVLGYRIDF